MQSRKLLFYKRITYPIIISILDHTLWWEKSTTPRRKEWYPGKGQWYIQKYAYTHCHTWTDIQSYIQYAHEQRRIPTCIKQNGSYSSSVSYDHSETPERHREGERERIETRTPNPSVCLFCILLHLQACVSICICVSLCTSRSWSVWPHLHHCSCAHGAFGSFGFVCDWVGQWIIQRWSPGHLSWEVAVQNTFFV